MLVLAGVAARYGPREVVRDIDLSVPAGQVVSLLGPSGSGKTTLLRLVAGLERPSAGRILLAGRDLADVPVHARGIGLMFQDYALFPHRDIGGNVGFGLRMAGWDAERIRARVAEVLALVGLPGTERRPVAQLSGGEQQRVALARAIAPNPRLLMLDEPMGSLDRALRERLPDELAALFRALSLTVLYVTHDQDEALRVADRIVLLAGGRIEADGTPEALWSAPPTVFAATFLGFRAIGHGTIEDGLLRGPWGPIPLLPGQPAGGAADDAARAAVAAAVARGTPVPFLLRPDALRLDAAGALAGSVAARRFRGDHVLVTVRFADAPDLEVEVRGGALPAPGAAVRVAIDPAGLVPLRD
ncbi:MAG: ABC transporter ATP-binding protein [Chloroflexota bacterium]